MKKLLNAVLRCTNFGFGIAIGIGMGWVISSSHGPVQAGGNPFAALQTAIANNALDIQDLQETSLTSAEVEAIVAGLIADGVTVHFSDIEGVPADLLDGDDGYTGGDLLVDGDLLVTGLTFVDLASSTTLEGNPIRDAIETAWRLEANLVGDTIKVGNALDVQADASTVGAIRWNSAVGRLEVSNGSEWISLTP